MFLNLSSFIPFPRAVTFYAALNTGNGDVLWSPILYVTSGRGSLLFLFTLYLFAPNRGPSVEILRILVSSQTGSVFPEAALRCRGPGFSLHLQAMLHVLRSQEL